MVSDELELDDDEEEAPHGSPGLPLVSHPNLKTAGAGVGCVLTATAPTGMKLEAKAQLVSKVVVNRSKRPFFPNRFVFCRAGRGMKNSRADARRLLRSNINNGNSNNMNKDTQATNPPVARKLEFLEDKHEDWRAAPDLTAHPIFFDRHGSPEINQQPRIGQRRALGYVPEEESEPESPLQLGDVAQTPTNKRRKYTDISASTRLAMCFLPKSRADHSCGFASCDGVNGSINSLRRHNCLGNDNTRQTWLVDAGVKVLGPSR
jgi:hypothetical protein